MFDNTELTDLIQSEDIAGIGEYFSENGYGLDTVASEFGENSREYELYERHLAELTFETRDQKYIIPQHQIGEKITKSDLNLWIRNFCEQNNLNLPKGFHKKTIKQLWGMYNGMAETYGFTQDQTFETNPRNRERGFNIRGYKHAQQILDWPTNESALRTLVYDVTRDSDLAEYLDYRGLRHQYYRIKGVAKKILRKKD